MPDPIEVHQDVAAPAAAVWEVMTDLDRAAQTIAGIESLERLDSGAGFDVGTTWRETRVMFGRSATEEMTVVAVDPGRSYTTEAANRGVRYTSKLSVEPTGADSCRLTMHFDAEVSDLLNRTLGAIVGRLMTGTTRKLMQSDLADIAAAAEARTG